MLIVDSIGAAIGLMLVGIVLLGSWPAAWNAVERRGRPAAHIFLDYASTYMAAATVTALTLGQLGPAGDPSLNFLDQLRTPIAGPLGFAVAGGAALAVGDIAMQYTTALLGLSVGPPLLNATTVVLGVLLTYFLDGGINKPQLVFPGMAAATLAIGLGAAAHVMQHRQHQQEQRRARCAEEADAAAEFGGEDGEGAGCKGAAGSSGSRSDAELAAAGGGDAAAAPQGGMRRERSIRLKGGGRWYHGLAVALAGGTVYSLFLPAFQVCATDHFGLLPSEPRIAPPSVWTTNFFFAAGFAATSAAANVAFLYCPPLGGRRSSLLAWLRDHDGRALSIASGLLAAAGDMTQFMGGEVAGYAAAMLVMAYPVVGVLWGTLSFKEHRGRGRAAGAVRALVAGQVALYLASVGLLAGSATLRRQER